MSWTVDHHFVEFHLLIIITVQPRYWFFPLSIVGRSWRSFIVRNHKELVVHQHAVK